MYNKVFVLHKKFLMTVQTALIGECFVTLITIDFLLLVHKVHVIFQNILQICFELTQITGQILRFVIFNVLVDRIRITTLVITIFAIKQWRLMMVCKVTIQRLP